MAQEIDNNIKAVVRTEFGKGASRRARVAKQVPAVLYGHGAEPRHLLLPAHDTMMALKLANAVLTLDIEGDEQLALVKEVQRDFLKPIIKHVDLIIVRKGEKVEVEVPVHVEGDAGPETLVTLDATTLLVLAEATNIPESITVSVEGLEAGSQILASGVTLPAGTELAADPDLLIVNITAQISAAELEADLESTDEAPAAEEAPAEEAAE